MLSIGFIAGFSLIIIKVKGPEYTTFKSHQTLPSSILSQCTLLLQNLLQAHLNNMAKECGPQAPVVNMDLPNNFGVYPDFDIAAGRAAGLTTTTTPSNQPHESTCLIPTNVSEGPKMDLKTFCHIYALPDSIRSCLHEHKITGMHAISHMTSDHLKEMEFKLGKSINLKEVIKCWAEEGD